MKMHCLLDLFIMGKINKIWNSAWGKIFRKSRRVNMKVFIPITS